MVETPARRKPWLPPVTGRGTIGSRPLAGSRPAGSRLVVRNARPAAACERPLAG